MRLFVVVLLAGLIQFPARAADVRGVVTRVVDGDTIVVLVGGVETTVRIAGIDAPESCQEGGARATQILADLVDGKHVVLSISGKDQYGRSLAEIRTLSGMNVGRELLESGAAWVYPSKSTSNEERAAEQRARSYTVGIWSLGSPVPPWEWRRLNPGCKAAANLSSPARQAAESVDSALSSLDLRSRAETAALTAPPSTSKSYSVRTAGSAGRGATYTGPRGGEFYYNSSGNKEYVKR